jgi:hypothetical protein
MTDFAVVVPTIGRKSFHRLLDELSGSAGPRPSAVIVVDALADAGPPLLSATRLPVTVVRSGGRGPACSQYGLARRPDPLDLLSRRRRDPAAEPVRRPGRRPGSGRRRRGGRLAGVIEVPGTPSRRATDDDRHTQRLPARNGSPPIWPTDARRRWLSAGSTNGFPFPIARILTLPCGSPWQATPLGSTRRSSHPVAAATPRHGTVSGLPSGPCQPGGRAPIAAPRWWPPLAGRVGRGRSPGAICSLVSG